MLLTTVALGLLLQAPQDLEMKTWVDRGYDPAQPNAYSVSGTPELSRKEAWRSVEQLALEDHQNRIRSLAETRAAATGAPWLPGFVKDRVVGKWASEQLQRARPKVLDRDLIVRDHGFGNSYQAFLLLEPLDSDELDRRGGLVRRLARAQEEFAMRAGGMVGLWGLLALCVLWLDRLTRGYMTKRLYAIGTLLALVGPALLVVL